MSYTPGTKLSYANGSECAMVLTNDMVMATMVEVRRERMSLADWLILAEGQETVVSHAGAILAAREHIYPERPVGTKLKWVSDYASSTIIVTKKGFLEVKRVPLLNDRPKTLYPSEAAWRATLQNGEVTVTPPVPTLIQQKLVPLPEGLTDIEKIEELSRRFNYRPQFILRPSQKMEVASYDKTIEEFKEKLALASGEKAFEIARTIHQFTRFADEARAKLHGMTEEQQNAQPIVIYQGRSPCAIHLYDHGVKQLIGSYTAHDGKKYLAYNGGPQGATTFAELGLGENPTLSVVYRRKTYVL